MRKKINEGFEDFIPDDYDPDKARTWSQAELDAINFPRPEEFARMFKNERVNLQLSARALAFFKRAAKKERVPYQRLIRAAVDYYVDHADQLQAA